MPRALETYLRRCLQKDPRQRVRDIGDVRLALDGAFDMPAAPGKESRPAAGPRRFAVVAVVAAIALVALAGRAWPSSETGAPGVTRVSIRLEPGQHLSGNRSMEDAIGRQRPSVTSFALSPDGRRLVYVASDGKTARLFDRPLDRAHATPVAGTEDAAYVLFAPDGRSVAFFAGGQVRRVDLDTGEVRTVALPGGAQGNSANWAADDTILTSTGFAINRVSSSGGTPTVLAETKADASGSRQAFFHPSLLPGARPSLFNLGATGVPSEWDVAMQSLETGQRTVVLAGGSDPRYLPPGISSSCAAAR